MKTRFGFLIICSFLAIVACEKEDNTGSLPKKRDTDTLKLRVKNNSFIQLDSFYVNTSGGEANFGSIASNNYSDYEIFDYSYSYFYMNFKVHDHDYTLQPIDYVGETKIDTAWYTVRISEVDTIRKTFNYNLIKD